MQRLQQVAVAFAIGIIPSVGVAQVGGIRIDPKGLVHDAPIKTKKELVARQREVTKVVDDVPQLTKQSSYRRISLRKLEEVVKKHVSAGEPLPPEVQYLAGLQRIDFVFFDEQGQDVILAGPADGWTVVPTGEIVGVTDGRPVIHLDDLLVAFRYAYALQADDFVGCSIDATDEGTRALGPAMRRVRPEARKRRPQQFLRMLERVAGPQPISIYGVRPTSQFARKLIAADYRLKRIALGHDPITVPGLQSYVDLAVRQLRRSSPPQKQHRWWFVANFNELQRSPDHLAFRLPERCLSVLTSANVPGAKSKKILPPPHPIAVAFAERFTSVIPQLAARIPIFAELENLVSLTVVAELIARPPSGRRDLWQPTFLVDDDVYRPVEDVIPEHVPALANARVSRDGTWLVSVSGGVEIRPHELIDQGKVDEKKDSTLSRRFAQLAEESSPRWWWD